MALADGTANCPIAQITTCASNFPNACVWKDAVTKIASHTAAPCPLLPLLHPSLEFHDALTREVIPMILLNSFSLLDPLQLLLLQLFFGGRSQCCPILSVSCVQAILEAFRSTVG